MSSGGGAQGETRYNWNDDMAPRWNSLLNTAPWAGGFEMNDQGNVVGIKPRETYGGERFAPVNYDQSVVGGYLRNMNTGSTSPLNAMNAARSQIEGTLGGDYLDSGGPQGNYFASLTAAGRNPYIGGNEYMGESPAFKSMVGDVLGNMGDAYQKGTAADTKAMFNLGGAFGGSAHQNAVASNEAGLAKAMGQTANQLYSDQFNRSAGLKEAEIGRGFQNYNSGLDRGFNNFENERNRQMGAVGMGQNEQDLAYQRAAQQFGYGSFLQGQDQQNRDFQFDQWNQYQNHPYQVMNWLSGLYGNAMGGGGMNQSVYGGGGSQWGPAIGGLLAGASMF